MVKPGIQREKQDEQRTALELRSLIRKNGELELSLVKVPVPEPGPDEVVVKVEASPINPSDLGLLVGPADMIGRHSRRAAATASSSRRKRAVSRPAVPRGAARPVDAGRQRRRGHCRQGGLLRGRAGTHGQDRVDGRRRDVCAVSPQEGERLPAAAGRHDRRRGRLMVRQSADRARHDRDDEARGPQGAGPHRRRVQPRPDVEQDLPQGRHRPGQRRAQRRRRPSCCATSARAHVVNSTAPSFTDDLVEALVETGATIAFDAIGGGKLASQILTAMEIAHQQVAPRSTAATAPACTSRSTSTAASTPARSS